MRCPFARIRGLRVALSARDKTTDAAAPEI
jgi:hypothetical protein